MTTRYLPLLVFLLLLSSATAPAAAEAPMPSVSFTHGLASGDVTPLSAVLWTRVNVEARLTVEVSSDRGFRRLADRRTVLAPASDDFTAKVTVFPLFPNTTYFYRFRHGQSVSEVGSFKTAPLPFVATDVRFVYSGDSDGTKVQGAPFFNHFESLDSARLDHPDFFVYLGDTIYADSELRALSGQGPARTLEQYRRAYKVNRRYDALRDLMRSTSTYAIWDDHEVRDDFDGTTVDPTLYANGREAFLEYMPILELDLVRDPGCAGAPLFRVFPWGKDLDMIILDERSCRSASVETVCQGDLAPTLPAPVRVQFGLPPTPPTGCLDALFDPSRTMLGERQKRLFKAVLRNSNAKFKVVINEVAIEQFYALPYDRWEGYAAERNEILDFIRRNHIDHVVFLTTDSHANLINEVFVDRFSDPAPIAQEFVTGPIATVTLQQDIERRLGAAGVQAFQRVLSLVGTDCRHLDAYSYGRVELNARGGTLTVSLRDSMGAVLHDQLNPAVTCTKTLP